MDILSFFRKLIGAQASSTQSPLVPQASDVPESAPETVSLDYDDLVHLDAEDLSEQGIADAFEALRERLSRYVDEPIQVQETFDEETGSYSIRYAEVEHVILSPELPYSRGEHWGRATAAFFALVNSQLTSSPVRFYAFNNGNDLSGMFLEPARAEEAKKGLKRRIDWPYIPDACAPWYGQFH